MSDVNGLPRCGRVICQGNCEVCARIAQEEFERAATETQLGLEDESPIYNEDDYNDSMDGDAESAFTSAGWGLDESYNDSFEDGEW